MISLYLLFPGIIGVLFLFLSNNSSMRDTTIKSIAIAISLLYLGASFAILYHYLMGTDSNSTYGLIEDYTWISYHNIRYIVGIDGLSALMCVLTAFLTLISLVSTWKSIKDNVATYIGLFFLIEFCCIGIFVAINVILFYIFFELVLVPMFFVIGMWGGKNKIYASMKFFIYTFFGSIVFLLALCYLIFKTDSASLIDIIATGSMMPASVQIILWICFFISFSIKVPMFPVHTWLPDAHVQAPTAGSVILAGVLIKLGAYGFIRYSIPILPEASYYMQNFGMILSVIAAIYGSIIAIKQTDIKKVVAYSSVAHMGYVTAGIFSMTDVGYKAAVFQMVSHGLISGGLFLCVGCMYDRLKTREFAKLGGVAEKMPVFAKYFMVLSMASVGLPGTSGFVGEFLAIVGSYHVSPLYALLIGTSVILGAVYTLGMYRKAMFGGISNPNINYLTDISKSEIFSLLTLSLVVVCTGVYPKLITGLL